MMGEVVLFASGKVTRTKELGQSDFRTLKMNLSN